MTDPNEGVFAELRRIFAQGDGFTGEATMHVQGGKVQSVRKVEVLKARDVTAPVDVTERVAPRA